jgi:glutamine amidotransferase
MSTENPDPAIAIIDYGMGNLRSVQKAFEKVGHQAVITSDPAVVAKAAKVVLPGVGAFEDAMHELRERKLVGPVLEAINSGRPFLGICLGLQLLFDVGYENGRHEGLGVLRGEVVKFDLPEEYSVPHMGWNQLDIARDPQAGASPVLRDIAPGTYVYFVHSYYVVPQDTGIIATTTDYGGPFCSMVWRDNIFASQFHPEKSQAEGLKILRNFAAPSHERLVPVPGQ